LTKASVLPTPCCGKPFAEVQLVCFFCRSNFAVRLPSSMRLDELDYRLPRKLIAQRPLDRRDASRLLFLDRSSGVLADRLFTEFPTLLRGDELLVFNNARVIPARLFGRRTGVQPPSRATRAEHLTGKVEIFLTREIDSETWEVLVRPGRKMQVGERKPRFSLAVGLVCAHCDSLPTIEATLALISSAWVMSPFRRTSSAPMKLLTASAIKPCSPNAPARLQLRRPVCISHLKFSRGFARGAWNTANLRCTLASARSSRFMAKRSKAT